MQRDTNRVLAPVFTENAARCIALFVELGPVRASLGCWRRLGIAAIVLQLLFSWPLGSVGAAENAETTTCLHDQTLCFKEMLPIQEMRATAYTKAFAQRFGLEPPAPGTEPSNGLEAMELRVERLREWSNFYSFALYLYLDSRLPVKLPESGMAGNKRMLLSPYHFFAQPHAQWMKWSVEDRRYSSKLDGNYNMKAFLATMDYVPDKKGAIDSIQYDEFHKELLPGITYIRLDVLSPLILNKPYTNVGIFLQQSTETEYRNKIYIEPGEFLKFKIPDHLYARMKEWNMKMEPVNSKVMHEIREKKKINIDHK